jgi:SHS2 domain-containing protein
MQNENEQAPPFTVVDHTADWALCVRGEDWPVLLRNAAEGMTWLMTGGQGTIPSSVRREIALTAPDRETLLVDWLSELAYLAEMELLVFSRIDVHDASASALSATVHGGRVEQLAKHIKAVTYHELKVREGPEGLWVTVVFDV